MRTFTYDNANQLVSVQVAGSWRTDFAYDGLGRCRWRKEYNGSGQFQSQVNYVYDGFVVIQERDVANIPRVTYTRGLDLSGSRQGAGGIGGLLARTDSAGTAYYHCDGSGNVTMLIGAVQTPVARYLYDSFGNVIGMAGPLADANVYRFSSKETHANSGLSYYGYRWYDPNLQRWINRDPIGERGGLNLYRFVANNPVSRIDPWGLFDGVTVPRGPGTLLPGPGSGLPTPGEVMGMPTVPMYPNLDKAQNWLKEKHPDLCKTTIAFPLPPRIDGFTLPFGMIWIDPRETNIPNLVDTLAHEGMHSNDGFFGTLIGLGRPHDDIYNDADLIRREYEGILPLPMAPRR